MINLLGFGRKDAERAKCTPLVNADSQQSKEYRLYKDFLDSNYRAMNLISRLEEFYYGEEEISHGEVRRNTRDLLESVAQMINSIQNMSGKYKEFDKVWPKIEYRVNSAVDSRNISEGEELVLNLGHVNRDMAWFVGGKASNLAVLKNEVDLPAPGGFVVSARAYQEFLKKNDLEKFIEEMLEELDVEDAGKLERLSSKIKDKFFESAIPENVQQEISQAINAMLEKYGNDVLMAVRSSAVGEDGDVSFAGQYSSYINIKAQDVLDTYKKVLASKYNSGALAYRRKHGLREDDTPMCVVVTTMVRAQASGVMYTQDPATGKESALKISAGYGFGQRIVSGEDTGDEYVVNKNNLKIENVDISPKKKMYSYGSNKWPRLMDVPGEMQEKQVLSQDEIQLMARYGLSLEKFFRQAQDVEWVRDEEGKLLIVQSRPLRLTVPSDKQGPEEETFIDEHPLIVSGGKTASRGRWTGKVYKVSKPRNLKPPRDAVLLTKTADPRYTEYLGRVGAVVTEVGSVTSHLASVAREYGVPAIFGMSNAFSDLEDGQEISVDALHRKVYKGIIEGFSSVPGMMAPSQPQSFNQRLKTVLDQVSTLNLVDPDAPEFQPEKCRTVHDVIRFLHERVISEMFRSEHDNRNYAILKSNIPLKIRIIDLGGGMVGDLTTCHEPVPEDIRSVPLTALWQGVSYPGINWSQSIGFSFANLGQLMTTPESESMKVVETVSYALVAEDYMNLSIKFGYHYANIEALCTDRVSQNLVNFQFSGGAGGYLGRSLRVLLLAEILEKLDFETDIQGDFLGASLKGFDCESIQEKLDQVGRLLACSRLLDMVLKNEADVQRLAARFMEGDYDFLSAGVSNPMPDFHLFEGSWEAEEDSSGRLMIQDGKKIVDPVSRQMACLMGRMSGTAYSSFLDRIKAYHYFPLAIAKDSFIGKGDLSVQLKCVDGCIDMTAGLALCVKDRGQYLVFGIDALKKRIVLWNVYKGGLEKLWFKETWIEMDVWYDLRAEFTKEKINFYLNKKLVFSNSFDLQEGYCGLWSKADTVAYFREFEINGNL